MTEEKIPFTLHLTREEMRRLRQGMSADVRRYKLDIENGKLIGRFLSSRENALREIERAMLDEPSMQK